jgi:hypothetical protein
MTVKLPMNQMNGMVMDATAAYKLQRQDIVRILVHFADIVKGFRIHVIYTTDKIMTEHLADVRSFLAGCFQTVRDMTTHKPDMSKLYTEKFLPGAPH